VSAVKSTIRKIVGIMYGRRSKYGGKDEAVVNINGGM